MAFETNTTPLLLKRLNWTVLRPLAYALGGSERSLMLGAGMELDELREYQPGDDIRLIDWNITARADTPYVRQSRVERAVDVWLLLDVSASVDWGTADCTKYQRAMEFATVVASVLGRQGNRIGAITFAEEPRHVIPPAAGRVHLMRLFNLLNDAFEASATQSTKPVRRNRTEQGATNLSAALQHADSVLRRKAVVLVVSDFITDDVWQPTLRRMAQRHELIAVQITDPREHHLPDVGLITLQDPETGEQMVVDTRSRKLRERYAQAAAAQAQHLRDEIASCGAGHLVLSTDEDLLPAMVRFLSVRKQTRLMARR